MKLNNTEPLFALGRTLATPELLALNIDFSPYYLRHECGDWGNIDNSIKRANDEELLKPQASRCFFRSSYVLPGGQLIHISTNLKLAITCARLAEEQ